MSTTARSSGFEPVRQITEEEIETFWRDGAVCLRGVIEADDVAALEAPIDRLLASPDAKDLRDRVRLGRSQLAPGEEDPFLEDEFESASESARYGSVAESARKDDVIWALATQSPLPRIAASILRSERVNYYLDQLLVKEPGMPTRTAFHVDEPYFVVEGQQVCTIWVPLDVVTVDTGAVGFVRGSHRWGQRFKSNDFVTSKPKPQSADDDRVMLPDIDNHPDDYDIVYYDTAPGDVTVHHYLTAHGSGGNSSSEHRRRAVAIRYCGDDVRYTPKTSVPYDTSYGTLREGDRLEASPLFPICWPPPGS